VLVGVVGMVGKGEKWLRCGGERPRALYVLMKGEFTSHFCASKDVNLSRVIE